MFFTPGVHDCECVCVGIEPSYGVGMSRDEIDFPIRIGGVGSRT